ncbi:glycosyltransferase family 4 protein [Nostoc linckia FACHB-104]|nr:glycosyltransferase family 4 protein [Nostoc linckia FACHB-104]
MNILHFNLSDHFGNGAGIAGYRLHQGLLAHGLNSQMFVGMLKTNDERIKAIPRSKALIEKIIFNFTWHYGLNDINWISSFDIPKDVAYQQADILNFHNLHHGYFNYLAVPSLTVAKPAVFTLHDMWSFTGHCSYSYDCDRWKIGCGKCPYPDTYPGCYIDNTHLEWKLKKWVFRRSNITIVAPSNWLAAQARQSILQDIPIHHIPYGIDTEAYQPLEREQCRSILGIAPHKKVLLFTALNLKDKRKGGDLLLKILQNLPTSLKADTVLLTIGNSGEDISKAVDMATYNLGYLNSDRLKSIAYSAADLFIFPTRADNLPLVLQESMACGTPMISFKIGGVPDLVRPDVTGYLASPEDTQDFCRGIVQLLEDHQQRHNMSQNCREIALQEYPLELQAQRYIDLYRQVLQN